METQLKDKVAIVTGAGQGIGKAIAIDLALNGANILVADIDFSLAKDVASSINTEAIPLKIDIANLDDIEKMMDSCMDTFKKIDILVNNAGITRFADVMEVTVEDWDSIHAVNARGTFFSMQFAAKQMIATRDGGIIINIASIAGKGYSGSSNAAYAASKGAIIAMTAIAAQQLGSYGIRVNSVCPGLTKTPLLDKIERQITDSTAPTIKKIQMRHHVIPTGRESTPEDIASMVTFLAGPGASNITGQAINVDGGLINH